MNAQKRDVGSPPAGSFVVALMSLLGITILVLAHGQLGRLDMTRAVSMLALIAMASAWNLVGGYGGLFSIGHAMFVGTGSYTTALMMDRLDVPLLVVLITSAAVAGVLGFVVSLPLMRLRAAYFSVASLGVALASQAWMMTWNWTGASAGLQIPLKKFTEPSDQYWIAATLVVVTVGLNLAVVRSGLGLRLMALRDDEDAAAEVGIRRTPVVMAVWTLSAMITGAAGGLVAIQKGTVEPVSAFSFAFSLDVILAAVIGGLGTVTGPILGAIVLYVLRQYLIDWQDWASVVLGCIIVLVIRFVPGGLWGTLVSAWRLVRSESQVRAPDRTIDLA